MASNQLFKGIPVLDWIVRSTLGTQNQRMVRRYLRQVDLVNRQEDSVRTLTDAQLRARTQEFRDRIKAGEKPFDLRPEIFATAREAMDRAVGIRNIFNPDLPEDQRFDPSKLPAPARALYDAVAAEIAATPAREPEGDLRGCHGPTPSWMFVDIPAELYEAVRVLYPESRPPFRARPFDVQIIGGVVLSEGQIAEMKTGEGKTIVGPLACYLAALEHLQVHVVTVNDYLVQRDRDWTFPFFRALGLTVGAIHPIHMQTHEEKRAAYACDVVYGTTSEFGFDYLRDNMKTRVEEQVQRRREFAIVDEVDSILIDEARTPLIISGMAHATRPRYELADRLARHLVNKQIPWESADEQAKACQARVAGLEGDIRNTRDRAAIPELKSQLKEAQEELKKLEASRSRHVQFYEVELDKKRATLTSEGIAEAQREAKIGSFYVGDNVDMPHLLEQSVRAHTVYMRDRDYVIAPDDQGQLSVVIVDQNTGRKMIGRQWSDGLHQAVESKEGVPIKEETQTMATITIQNFFKLYKRLAGMTGTADTEATEFHEIYRLGVVSIPTNRPVIRDDRNDVVYLSQKDKWNAIVDEIKRFHDAGRPVLVGTTSVEKSEVLSRMLKQKHGIPHEVLNAKQHEREAEIVASAGQLGAVMIATNMAGRGTDIKLGRVDPERLVEHWKRRDLAPKDATAAWGEERLLAAMRRHMAKRMLRRDGRPVPAAEIDAMDDAAVELELLRHWVLEMIPGASANKVASASRDDLVGNLDSLGNFMLHSLRLFPNVEEMGGLHIIGTERHESRRIDNQLRGRAGRQGDQGSSRFFLALDDDLMKLFAGKVTLAMLSKLGMKEGDAIEAQMLTRQIEKAQRKVEERNFQIRKNILEYDEPMEYQRRTFYGMRQPVLEHRGIRDVVVQYIDDSAYDAAERYLGPDYVAQCISEWVREHYSVAIEAERFKGKDREKVKKVIDTETLEEASTTIGNTVGEYMDPDTDSAEWNVEELQDWARVNFGAELPRDLVLAGDPDAVRRAIEAAAAKKFAAIDNSPVEAFLVKNYGAAELARWASNKFGAEVAPSIFDDCRTPQEAGARLAARAMEIFHERELRYPVDFAIEMTSQRLQQAQQDPENGQAIAGAALAEFCAWAKARYGVEWSPETLPSQQPADLARALVDRARQIDEAEIDRRAKACLETGRGAEAIAAWFEQNCMVRLGEFELEQAAADPENFVRARLRSFQRQELEQFERWVLLQIFDEAWKNNLHAMDQLRDSIGFRGIAQKDPRIEFKKGAAETFNEMLETIRERATDLLFKGRLAPQVRPAPRQAVAAAPEAGVGMLSTEDPAPSAEQQAQIEAAELAGAGGAPVKKELSGKAMKVVGRNEPCPCGSGKKYKNCHGAVA
ncbi:MAG: preprotein translocase subunit SecA [Phycisphaerales bacterium]